MRTAASSTRATEAFFFFLGFGFFFFFFDGDAAAGTAPAAGSSGAAADFSLLALGAPPILNFFDLCFFLCFLSCGAACACADFGKPHLHAPNSAAHTSIVYEQHAILGRLSYEASTVDSRQSTV